MHLIGKKQKISFTNNETLWRKIVADVVSNYSLVEEIREKWGRKRESGLRLGPR